MVNEPIICEFYYLEIVIVLIICEFYYLEVVIVFSMPISISK